MNKLTDDYLERAQKAEERAQATADPDMKARWLGIAFGYRELSRYRNSLAEFGVPVDSQAGNTAWRKPMPDKSSPHSRT